MGGRGPNANMGREKQKPSDFSSTLRRLLPYWLAHWPSMLLILCCSLASVGISVYTPVLIGRAIDECIVLGTDGEVSFRQLAIYLVILGLLYLISLACGILQERRMVKVSQSVVSRMRQELMSHLLSLDVRFFDAKDRGDLLSRFSSDADLVKEGMGMALIQTLTTALSVVGMLVVMLQLSPSLTLICLVAMVFVVLLSRFVISRSRRLFVAQQNALGNLTTVIEESVGGLHVIRSLGCEDAWGARFFEASDNMRKAGMGAQINSGMLMPLLRVLDSLAYIAVAVFGGLLALNGKMSVGTIQSFLLYTRNLLRPVNMIATQMNTIQSAFAGAERIFEMLDIKPSVKNGTLKIEPSQKGGGRVEFRNVSFSYVADQPVLKGVSFVAEPGQMIAIVGSTGAGKTTIINILSRFYDYDGGKVLLDDVDIRDYDKVSLRQRMSIVFQDPFLFSDYVYKNICYGDLGPTSVDSARSSATLALADAFIESMPDAYNTVLLRQGESLSNGQRQQLTIARAIHRDAPIIILDEATSNIDTHTERQLQDAIRNLTNGRTCLVIAHRLSTVRNADNILVLHNGHVAETGSHDQLMQQNGIYSRLYNSQFSQSE